MNACTMTMVFSCTLPDPKTQRSCQHYRGDGHSACAFNAGWKLGYPVCRSKPAQLGAIDDFEKRAGLKKDESHAGNT